MSPRGAACCSDSGVADLSCPTFTPGSALRTLTTTLQLLRTSKPPRTKNSTSAKRSVASQGLIHQRERAVQGFMCDETDPPNRVRLSGLAFRAFAGSCPD
eukprot:1291463-Amphidinium_carterae.2